MDNLLLSFYEFGKVLLQETICFLREDKFYLASVPSHALEAQCSQGMQIITSIPLCSVQGLNYAVRFFEN